MFLVDFRGLEVIWRALVAIFGTAYVTTCPWMSPKPEKSLPDPESGHFLKVYLLATPLPPTPPPAIGDRRSAPICDLQSAIGSHLWLAIGDRLAA